MFEFLKPKLTTHIKRSAEAIETYENRKETAAKIFEETEASQPAIEQAFLAYFACQQTHGSPKRLRELEALVKQKTQERDTPRAAAKRLLDQAANDARATTGPAITWAGTWIRGTMQAAPTNEGFTEYCLKAIQEIENMQLRPLADVLKTIEKHAAVIQAWDFGEKLLATLPALSVQSLAL
jgi:hypothetical protein